LLPLAIKLSLPCSAFELVSYTNNTGVGQGHPLGYITHPAKLPAVHQVNKLNSSIRITVRNWTQFTNPAPLLFLDRKIILINTDFILVNTAI